MYVTVKEASKHVQRTEEAFYVYYYYLKKRGENTEEKFKKESNRLYVNLQWFIEEEKQIQEAYTLYWKAMEYANNEYKILARELVKYTTKVSHKNLYHYLKTGVYKKKDVRELYISLFKQYIKEKNEDTT